MTADPIRFLSTDDVLRLHALAIADQNGDPSIRDRGLLESALAMPRQQFGGEYLHADIPAMAGAYAFHICKNHPFIDGNKRAATAAMIAFLSDNAWAFDAGTDDAEKTILALAAGEFDKPAFTDWLRAHCHQKPSMELREFFAAVSLAAIGERGSLFHYDAGISMPEFLAAINEASSAMPIVGSLHAAISAIATADHVASDNRHILGRDLKTFLALYRLAEDMGYEW